MVISRRHSCDQRTAAVEALDSGRVPSPRGCTRGPQMPQAREGINLWPTATIGRRWVTMLELLRPQPGEQILDVGFGRGEALRWIAARLGASGRAVGVEVKQELLDALMATCEAAGQQNIEVQ